LLLQELLRQLAEEEAKTDIVRYRLDLAPVSRELEE
jgi:hypothetical protein